MFTFIQKVISGQDVLTKPKEEEVITVKKDELTPE
jgi:hypothetical protein